MQLGIPNSMATAIAKAKVKGAKRPDVGTHFVNFWAHITGTLTVGEGYKRAPTASIPLKAALALASRYSGITREAFFNALERGMTEALRREEDSILQSEDFVLEAIGEEAEIDRCMERVNKLARALPQVSVNGQITNKLEVVEVREVQDPSVPNEPIVV